MSTKEKKTKEEEIENEVYYELNISELTIEVHAGGVVIFQSGKPSPPPVPPNP